MSRRTFQSMTFLPGLHDMRCKAPRIFEIIRAKYHRDKLNGDVYIFMSKDQTKVKTGQGTGHEVNPKSWTQPLLFICE